MTVRDAWRDQPRHPRGSEFGGRWAEGISRQIAVHRLMSQPRDVGLLSRAVGGGFTYSVIGRDRPTTGYALSPYPDRSQAVPTRNLTAETIRRYRDANQDLLSRPNHYLGAWRERDGETDRVWLDVSILVQDRDEAARIGREHNQIAMWDLGAGEEIGLGGTGD